MKGLKDETAKAAINDRIDRLALGNLGDVHPITGAPGLYELRIDHGPGYRVYFITVGKTILLLLCGGDKSTETADIKDAKRILLSIKGTSKNRRERQQWRLRSGAVQAYSEHRRPSVQRAAGFSSLP